jgi:hypothetical protein
MPSHRVDSPYSWALTFSIPALVFVMALLFGCATPAPIYRLDPRTPDVIWVGGRASVQQERGGIRVAAAFERQQGDSLALRVEIQNGSESRLEIGPQKMWHSPCSSPAVESCRSSERVIDPEAVLAKIDEKQSVDRAAASNSQAALGTLVILSAVTDAASVGSGTADGTTGFQTVSTAHAMSRDAARRSVGLASLEQQRQAWSNEALRRNTLFPGQGTSGIVFVPIFPDARFVWVQMRVGSERFAFHFEQNVRAISVAAPGSGLQARRDSPQ